MATRIHGGTKHGMVGTPVYQAWKNMKNRCYREADPRYARYGGRGIRVCDRWMASFEFFLADMGEPPPGMSLERNDKDGHYGPGNCRWATDPEQRRNRSDNKKFLYKGKELCLVDIAKLEGVPYGRVHQRLAQGMTLERALAKTDLRTGK